MEGPVIRANFAETEEYYLEAWARDPRHVKPWISYVAATGAAVLVSGVLALRDFRRGDSDWWVGILVGVFVGGLALYWLSPSGKRRQVRKALRKRLATPPAQSWFEFGPDGFSSTGQGGKSAFHPWSTIPRAVERTDGLVLFLDTHVYHWIPKNAFANRQDYDSVLERIANKVGRLEHRDP